MKKLLVILTALIVLPLAAAVYRVMLAIEDKLDDFRNARQMKALKR